MSNHRFNTKEEAMLAAEVDDALHGGTEPLKFQQLNVIRQAIENGHLYQVAQFLGEDEKYLAQQSPFDLPKGQQEHIRLEFFDNLEAAQKACEDWAKIAERDLP